MRVLVVDDDQAIREFVCWVLTDEGYEVASAANGKLALQVLERMQPDVILLDMRMPVMDGWEFARAYRDGRGATAPLIVLTAAQDAGRRAFDVSADGYLGKPFDVEDLIETVHRFAT
jgi:two-component system, chemotaxis family, chemotaxis protein CheY